MRGKLTIIFALVLVLVVAAVPCLALEVHVMAPVSIKGALDEIAESYVRSNPGARITRKYGISSVLAHEAEAGAPVHLFIAAHSRWVDYLKLKNPLFALTLTDLAYNSLVLAGSPKTTVKIFTLQDLLQLKKINVGSSETCRLEYAQEAFRNAGIDKSIAPRLVMSRDLREAYSSVERGEVEAAIIFRTDALARHLKILYHVPQNFYSRVTYPVVLTQGAAQSKEAQAFYRFLLGSESKRILEKHGFLTH